ncbi:MAG: RT0821/Lpp0805 family surface protein [Nitratireductor sp.]
MRNPETVSGTTDATESSPAKAGAHSRFLNIALVFAAVTSLPACTLNKTMSSLESEPQIVTSSVTQPVKAEGIDSTDAEMIKNVVAEAEGSQPSPSTLAWSNPDTGNSGTIMAIDKFVGSHGQKCKKFQTTVDSFMGISLYKGETCELKSGFWVLSWFLRD